MLLWIKNRVLKVFGKTENSYYIKIKKLIDKEVTIRSCDRIVFLGGFKFSESNYAQAKNLIRQDKLRDVLENFLYDTQSDNVEIFYFENCKTNLNYLVLILDHVELYSREELMDIIEFHRIDYESIKHEVIYQET